MILPQIEKPWVENENNIWLATTLELQRNIDKFHFPARLDQERKAHIVKLIYSALLGSKIKKDLKLLPTPELTPLDREYVLEHFLIFGSVPQPHPGEAYLIDGSGLFLGMINIIDHLHLFAINTSQDLERSWQMLTQTEEALSKSIQFAFSNEFGYLTADPFQAGTGLVVSAFLHVPALLLQNNFSVNIAKDQQESVVISNLQGRSEDFLGDMAVVKNRYTLGVTEEIIISTVHQSAFKLMTQEKHAREELLEKPSEEALDRVSRALGVLQHSYTIGTSEALRNLSYVKLGLELGWIKGGSAAALNKLFFDCRRAHLSKCSESTFSIEHAHTIRASFLREQMVFFKFCG